MTTNFRPMPTMDTPIVKPDGTLKEYEYWFGLDRAARTGTPGPAGPQGPEGPQGEQGPQGIQGPAGPTGATGATGATGPKGDTGDTGPAGADGADGADGATGATGPKGDKGDKGDTGDTGATGPAGADGADGVGIPVGGTTGQFLKKNSGTDYDTVWGSIAGSTVYTNTLLSNVSLTSTSSYFTGPTVAQGTSGRWFATGTVTMRDSTGPAHFWVALWDGTTTVASTVMTSSAVGGVAGWVCVTLSGIFTNPSGNIRISVKDSTSTSGSILVSASGFAKDSTLTVISLP